ncbi:thiamine-binding protein [Kitasatospora sp. NBC_01266]|uniref:thiamine-binding protein n=1 Tax=Kitasatospora sp. NBC_01266 TaxID=2903572 RepID=UPI003FA528AF
MVEFTTEPFELVNFPDHAVAARRVVDEAGLAVSVGPFGTSAEGAAEQVLGAVTRLLHDSLEAGASRISFQVSVVPEADADANPEAPTGPDSPEGAGTS